MPYFFRFRQIYNYGNSCVPVKINDLSYKDRSMTMAKDVCLEKTYAKSIARSGGSHELMKRKLKL